MKYPPHLIKLIHVLKKFPGVGNKSAERFAFHLLDWNHDELCEMAEIMREVHTQLKCCAECGCLSGLEKCIFCDNTRRPTDTICVIATPRDAFAIEETHEYKGLYHVLGGVLSPMEGKGPNSLSIPKLKERIQTLKIKEIVIALDSTLEGDATALYLKQELDILNISISRLAFGLPMGSSLDYIDGGTLARAFSGRQRF